MSEHEHELVPESPVDGERFTCARCGHVAEFVVLDDGLSGEWVDVTPSDSDDVYVVEGPRGFTESFDRRTIDTLERLGLIRHVRDGHVLEDGAGRGVGPLHRFYGMA